MNNPVINSLGLPVPMDVDIDSGDEEMVPEYYAEESELKEELDECLSSLQSDGSFALFEQLKNPPNPGLRLKEGGIIGLPLNDHDALLITNASHAAPFGKGEETIVDTSVRKTWELSPQDFEIRNPAWKPFLDTIVTKVSAGLGVDATGKGVSAQLYKMLLYDEGAMFKPHQDSEKAPHMFATLVIALPSSHKGGDVHVTHNGQTKVFATSTTSEFDASYLAWFADVIHEVKPVTQGRRLVLTYNLVHDTLGPRELAASSDVGLAKLKTIMSKWAQSMKEEIHFATIFAVLLEHQYTDASLCYEGLKGHDRNTATHLRDACDQLGFSLYLASFEMTVEGGCDESEDDWGYGGHSYGHRSTSGFHEITEEVESTTTLKRVVELDGTQIARELPFDEDCIIPDKALKDEEPDDEEYSGFTGNEGVSATHFYRRTVIAIMPKSARMEFIFPAKSSARYYRESSSGDGKPPDVLAWMESLSSRINKNAADEDARDFLQQICALVLARTKAYRRRPAPAHSWQRESSPFNGEVLSRVLKAAVELDDRNMLLEMLELCPQEMNTSTFEVIGTAFTRYGLGFLLPMLSARLAKIAHLSQRYKTMLKFRKGLDIGLTDRPDSPLTEFKAWIETEVNNALTSPAVCMDSPEDGTVLADLCKGRPTQEVFDKILPAAKRNVGYTVMAIAFAIRLLEVAKEGQVKTEVADTVFRDVISDVAESFSLRSLVSETTVSKKQQTGYDYRLGSYSIPEPITAVDTENSNNIATLLCHCQIMNLDGELDRMMSNIINEMKDVNMALFEAIYLPLLRVLLTKSLEMGTTAQDSAFSKLYQATLDTYVARFVKAEPTPLADWARPPVNCSCKDCQELNAFLTNRQQKQGNFSMGEPRRKHLQSFLRPTDFDLNTIRSGSPHTLVVTKNNAQYKADHKAWVKRCNVAKKHFSELGSENLRKFLGDSYDQVVSLSPSVLSRQAVGHDSRPSPALISNQNVSNRTLPPITKRKVPDVIVVD